jgi:hypothetical protein
MPRIGLQFHSLARVKPSDGIYQSHHAVGGQFIDLYVGRQVFANVEGDALHKWKHFNQQAFPANVAIQSRSRSLRLAATGRCAFHSQLAGLNRAPGFLNGSFCVDFLFHAVSPFLARFSRKTQGEWGA